jgi:hypothetical protein
MTSSFSFRRCSNLITNPRQRVGTTLILPLIPQRHGNGNGDHHHHGVCRMFSSRSNVSGVEPARPVSMMDNPHINRPSPIRYRTIVPPVDIHDPLRGPSTRGRLLVDGRVVAWHGNRLTVEDDDGVSHEMPYITTFGHNVATVWYGMGALIRNNTVRHQWAGAYK